MTLSGTTEQNVVQTQIWSLHGSMNTLVPGSLALLWYFPQCMVLWVNPVLKCESHGKHIVQH